MTAEHAAKPALLLVHDPVPVGARAVRPRGRPVDLYLEGRDAMNLDWRWPTMSWSPT
jgi:hypothetical protein